VSVVIQDSQQVDLTANFTDAAGNPDTAGTVAWTVDNGAVVSLVNANQPTVTAVAGSLGDAMLTATKTDPDGNTYALPPCGVTVTGGDATGGQITAGTPVAKAASAPAATPAPAAAPTAASTAADGPAASTATPTYDPNAPATTPPASDQPPPVV
jgi:hypothetical protein